MLIEFNRAVETEEGEVTLPISINAKYVEAVLATQEDASDITIVRLSGGRGFRIRGTYAEVIAKLDGTQVQ